MWCNVARAAGVGEEIFNMRSKLRSLGRTMDLRSSSQILSPNEGERLLI